MKIENIFWSVMVIMGIELFLTMLLVVIDDLGVTGFYIDKAFDLSTPIMGITWLLLAILFCTVLITQWWRRNRN